jgi:8-oxo-dGTP diphosphatase
LINENGQMLVQRRPEGKSMAGLWEFPGGKVEFGEGLTDAISRELHEELAIIALPNDFAALTFASEFIGERELLLLLYTCRQWSGTPSALHASEIRWVTADELMALPMPPADAPFIRTLRKFLSSTDG